MSIWDRLFRREKGTREGALGREQPVSAERRVDPLGLGQGTDIGKVRTANEDAFLTLKCLAGTDPDPLPVGVLIVADGMGGHVRGKEASSLSIRIVSSIIVKEILLPLLQRGSAEADWPGAGLSCFHQRTRPLGSQCAAAPGRHRPSSARRHPMVFPFGLLACGQHHGGAPYHESSVSDGLPCSGAGRVVSLPAANSARTE